MADGSCRSAGSDCGSSFRFTLDAMLCRKAFRGIEQFWRAPSRDVKLRDRSDRPGGILVLEPQEQAILSTGSIQRSIPEREECFEAAMWMRGFTVLQRLRHAEWETLTAIGLLVLMGVLEGPWHFAIAGAVLLAVPSLALLTKLKERYKNVPADWRIAMLYLLALGDALISGIIAYVIGRVIAVTLS